jgi:hypothetical protein
MLLVSLIFLSKTSRIFNKKNNKKFSCCKARWNNNKFEKLPEMTWSSRWNHYLNRLPTIESVKNFFLLRKSNQKNQIFWPTIKSVFSVFTFTELFLIVFNLSFNGFELNRPNKKKGNMISINLVQLLNFCAVILWDFFFVGAGAVIFQNLFHT